MPTMQETRTRLVEGATKEQLLEEGHSASSISKCQNQLKKAGESNGHIPFASLSAPGFPRVNPSAEKTQELSEEVRQAKLNQELSALQGGGSELQQVRAEMQELRQVIRDQEHRAELGRLEAKITAMEGQVTGVVHQPSALEVMIQPFLAKVIERGLDPVDAGLQIDLGTCQGIGFELLDKLDDLVGRRQERTIRTQFFEKAYEYLPDVIEAAKRMAAGVEAHAKERGVDLGDRKDSGPGRNREGLQVHNCPNCGVGLGAEPTDELIRCPSCGVTFEAASLLIVEEGPAYGGEQSGGEPEPLGGRSPTFVKDSQHG